MFAAANVTAVAAMRSALPASSSASSCARIARAHPALGSSSSAFASPMPIGATPRHARATAGRVRVTVRAKASDGDRRAKTGDEKGKKTKTKSTTGKREGSSGTKKKSSKARTQKGAPFVEKKRIAVKDTYVSPIGALERKLPGRGVWFRKGNATTQDARPDGLGASSKPLLTPGTKAWYKEWLRQRRIQIKDKASRELRKTARKPVEDYAKPGQAAGKPLSIDELKYTALGRAKIQSARQHIAYNRFVHSIMNEEIKELYVSVDAVARYAIVYKDGRIAYCQVAPHNTEVYNLTQSVGLEINPTMAEASSHTIWQPSAIAGRQIRTFIAGYGVPSVGVFLIWAIVFYMQRFRGDWEDRQKILELERAEEAQRQAEKGDPRINALVEMLQKLDENDPRRDDSQARDSQPQVCYRACERR